MPMSPRLLRPIASRLTLPTDADARAYVLAVNEADGQPLEATVVQAIDNFVIGCKADGIWSAIKASCILAGARTLAGALTPLVGPAPTNNGPFVEADYNRETGLKGNGTTKYLNSNRTNNADPQDSQHMAFFATVANTDDPAVMMGSGPNSSTGANQITNASSASATGLVVYSRLGTALAFDVLANARNATGFHGISRSSGSEYSARANQTTATIGRASAAPTADNIFVFDRGPTGGAAPTDARLAFYSIGESVSLALLDARVSVLITAIGNAI